MNKLWGVKYSDNNRVDSHNVFMTKGAAMMRANEAAIPATVEPMYEGSYVLALVEALKAARTEIEGYEADASGEGYNNPEMNALISSFD